MSSRPKPCKRKSPRQLRPCLVGDRHGDTRRQGTTCSRRQNPEAAANGRDRPVSDRRWSGAVVLKLPSLYQPRRAYAGSAGFFNDDRLGDPSMKTDRGSHVAKRQVGMSGWKRAIVGLQAREHPERREQVPGCEGSKPHERCRADVPGEVIVGLRFQVAEHRPLKNTHPAMHDLPQAAPTNARSVKIDRREGRRLWIEGWR